MDKIMKTYNITKKDLDKFNNYIGKTNLADYQGTIISDENLGVILFVSIAAKGGIYFKAGTGITAGTAIKAGDEMTAGTGITAGWGITAGNGITAGDEITAGTEIKAGTAINAGLSITCKKLSSNLRIFAGICSFRIPDVKETMINCEELVNGEICFGTLNITKPKETDRRRRKMVVR